VWGRGGGAPFAILAHKPPLQLCYAAEFATTN